MLAGAVALAGIALGALPTLACTTVCLFVKGRAVLPYNYDFDPPDGLVMVNKRGTAKRSRVQGTGWVARHGSVTFNQFGRDQPTTGPNEKGLMVTLMWLDETRYPPPGERPALGILRPPDRSTTSFVEPRGRPGKATSSPGLRRPGGGGPAERHALEHRLRPERR